MPYTQFVDYPGNAGLGYSGNPSLINACDGPDELPGSPTQCKEAVLAAAWFYDLEGTLVSTNLVHTLGFYARNQPGLFRSFKKSAATILSLPLFAVTDQYSRKVFNDLFFTRYKGESEDRLRFFADDLFEKVLKPAVFPGTFELIEKAKSLGMRQVVVTGALDLSVKPLMDY